MISISDNLHQLAVAVAGGLSPLNFLSRGARAPLAPLVPTPLSSIVGAVWLAALAKEDNFFWSFLIFTTHVSESNLMSIMMTS